ncbi:FtsQ-type POTRA domain-containing protein [Thermosynechococcus sp. HN-54]|uniref:cell division protein FtsQ/DivIB n=1 Tax=Thermosynechococcus sp. HN-54 TaxID=2933959 RepID=UPI00202CE224|nr:FtsQ-type POTRA domain-containing protein [Thermosynechococcus sp. HN-54]URR36169.1 FtsQ-type POTRA domain-containing protein [Thermosynechococcus sp. HN-54]
MVNPTPQGTTTHDAIRERRRQLQSKRRWRQLAGLWRTSVLLTLTGGLIWGLTLPDWIIRRPEQVVIRGNQLLKREALQAQLPLEYPESLLRLRPQEIIHTLETTLPLQRVTIARQLFPPTLIVEVQERKPVAVALCNQCWVMSETGRLQGPASRWLVDGLGFVAPVGSYQASAVKPMPTFLLQGYFVPVENPPRPQTLAVDGDRQQQWQQIHQILQQQDLPITGLDWRNEQNLIVQTPLVPVHLGVVQWNSPTFKKQLSALASLKQLPQYLDPRQMVFIDLVNPDEPLVQLRQQPTQQPLPRSN